MTILDGVFIGVFLAFITIAFIWIADIIYFHFRYQKPIDEKVCEAKGEPYVNMGLLVGGCQLMAYGGGLLFPNVAKRNGFHEIVKALPKNQRYHLVFIFVANVITLSLLILGVAMMEIFNL